MVSSAATASNVHSTTSELCCLRALINKTSLQCHDPCITCEGHLQGLLGLSGTGALQGREGGREGEGLCPSTSWAFQICNPALLSASERRKSHILLKDASSFPNVKAEKLASHTRRAGGEVKGPSFPLSWPSGNLRPHKAAICILSGPSLYCADRPA